MKIRLLSFNTYLLLLLIGLNVSCKTTEQKKKDKEATTLRLHLEMNSDGSDRSSGVPVYRENPVRVNVGREAFLHEGDIQQAAVVDVMGGFAIQLQFNRHGSLVLETVTTRYKGKRIAIFGQFGDARWLAAPILKNRITNGLFVFTPDASREEAERIVRGLNNIAKELEKSSRF